MVGTKGLQLHHINHVAMNQLNPEDVHVIIEKVETAEVDEMWSYVGNKTQQRWLWHALDHRTGVILAYVLAPWQDEVFTQLKALLAPQDIHHFYTNSANDI